MITNTKEMTAAMKYKMWISEADGKLQHRRSALTNLLVNFNLMQNKWTTSLTFAFKQ